MKKLYQFSLKEKTTVKKEEKSKDAEGKEITITKDVEEEVERHIFLRKPNRVMYDEAELFYGVQLSQGIKAGLLTRALLSKRFSNDGGVMSETDKEEYSTLYLRLFENQNEIERLTLKDKEKTEEEKKRFSELMKENGVIKRDIQDFELSQASLFEQTAENRARNKTILWWVLNMSHYTDENGENPKKIFTGESHEDRLGIYDKMEEEGSEFEEEVLKKLVYYVSYWYVGNAQTEEEFKGLLSDLETSGAGLEAEVAIEEASVEPPKEEPPKEEPPKEEPPKEEPPKEEPPKEEPPKEEPPKEEATDSFE